ncbi:thrombospondin-4- hypothetical protein [Limosa lapponica baueri]|uniref:Uncharacterized protein n=1 Tax=Limosa lapponica baueri TaxID=1758121 RepID=A0A2I0TG71_LIMLA|nr:thrombospondin-4- hypothetical protein [Limosa lapponica baueri]
MEPVNATRATMPPEEVVTRAEEAPPYNELSDNEKQYALFTDGSCHVVGKHRRWKVLLDELQKQLKEKMNQVNLQSRMHSVNITIINQILVIPSFCFKLLGNNF